MASDAIKPEDIGAEIIDAVEDKCGCGSGAWDCIPETELIAAILNAAIEAGLVSPPCWEVVGDDYKIAMVFKRKVSAERWMASDHGFRKAEVRHWKGQTK